MKQDAEVQTEAMSLDSLPLDMLTISCITFNVIDKIKTIMQEAEKELCSVLVRRCSKAQQPASSFPSQIPSLLVDLKPLIHDYQMGDEHGTLTAKQHTGHDDEEPSPPCCKTTLQDNHHRQLAELQQPQLAHNQHAHPLQYPSSSFLQPTLLKENKVKEREPDKMADTQADKKSESTLQSSLSVRYLADLPRVCENSNEFKLQTRYQLPENKKLSYTEDGNTSPNTRGSKRKIGKMIKEEQEESLSKIADSRTYHCSQCKAEFPCVERLTKHLSLVHPIRVVGSDTGQQGILGGHQCVLCNMLFMTGPLLREHQLRQHRAISKGSGLICRICGKSCLHEHEFTLHTKKHTQSKAFRCRVCYKGFSQKDSLDHHLLVIHDVKKP